MQRDRSWKIRPYPCIGQWGFLESGIFHSDAYGTVVERLKNGQTFLDIGCCMGQDLRRLAVDGAPTANMYATDIMAQFWEIGYDLFRDRGSIKAQFLQADIRDGESALNSLHGRMDVVYVGSVLHLFDWAKQLEVARLLVKLSKAGTTIIGCQIGREFAGEVPNRMGGDAPFFHNVESLKKMWHVIEEDTGTCWTVQASLGSLEVVGLEREDTAWMRPGSLLLQFLLTRIEK